MKTMHAEYDILFSFLEKEKFVYCLLRKAPDSLESIEGDVDILVEEARYSEIIKKLISIGYLIKTTEKRLPYKTVLVKYLKEKPIVLDLHRKIIQHGFTYLDEKRILESRKKYKQWYIPRDQDLLLLLIVHNIVGKGKIQKKHLQALREVRNIESIDFVLDYFPKGELRNAIENILKKLVDAKNDIIIDKSIRLLLQNFLASKTPFSVKCKNWWSRTLRKFNLYPRAPLYVLLGVDGVGKSSLLDAFEKKINSTEILRAKTIYMGPWGHYQFMPIKSGPFSPKWSVGRHMWWQGLWSKNKKGVGFFKSMKLAKKNIFNEPFVEQEKEEFKKLRDNSRLYLTLRFLRSFYRANSFFVLLMVEMLCRYYKIYKLRRRGITVIADRYIYDLMTGRMHEVIPQYRRVRQFLCNIFFKPTKVFLLTNDPEIIFRRKKDLKKDQLIKFMEIYQQMSRKYGFIEVPTKSSPDELAQNLLENHFSEIVDRGRV